MKHLLLTTIAAVLLVGCGPPKPTDISIHDAALRGNIKAVKYHLAAGADVNAKSGLGLTPLDMATIPQRIPMPTTTDLLRKRGGKAGIELEAEESIHVASKYGNIEAVKQHLAAGADVNAKSDNGYTPLHNAAEFGNRVGKGKEIVELLIAAGADVNAKDRHGKTPLDAAKYNREIADLLRKHGGKTGEELKAEGK